MSGKVDIINDGPNTTISLNGSNATITAGGSGQHGILSLHDAVAPGMLPFPRIVLNAGTPSCVMSRPQNPGESGFFEVIGLHGNTGDVSIGGNGQDGDLALFPASLKTASPISNIKNATVHLRASDATMRAGGAGQDGRVLLLNAAGAATIIADGKAGDIILKNADCAEDFDIALPEEVTPGTVVIIDDEEQLRRSVQAYDRRVAGVISGAGDFKPAIVLDKQDSRRRRLPVALVGKVYCQADAKFAPIAVGDLLTTSPTPGHAMKAVDPLRAFGAVIGKALRRLDAGRGLIPILVALQ